MKTYRIVAIDGGTTQSAYVVLRPQIPQICDYGILDNESMLERLKALRSETGSSQGLSDQFVVEQIKSYGNPIGDSLLHTCVWNGRFIEAWIGESDRTYTFLPRKTVVTELCGSPKAKDSNVRQALIDYYADRTGEKAHRIARKGGMLHGIKKDIWSALAIATAHYAYLDRQLKTLLD